LGKYPWTLAKNTGVVSANILPVTTIGVQTTKIEDYYKVAHSKNKKIKSTF
jgi:hypothetical protein